MSQTSKFRTSVASQFNVILDSMARVRTVRDQLH